MIRIVLATALTLAVLLLCGGPPQVLAQSDTKIVIKDGGSLLLQADGLDAGTDWTVTPGEVRHRNEKGKLKSLRILDGNRDACAGSPSCGIDATKPWSVTVIYGAGSVTMSSLSASAGLHLTHKAIPFDQWKRTANADEREFGHGDGQRIKGIKVNHGANLCSGKGCSITLLYSHH